MDRISTGIPKLDEVLGGGVLPGSNVLIEGIPGIDTRVFAYHMFAAHPDMDHVYLVDNTFPSEIRKHLSRFLFDIDRITFVDAFSSALGMPSEEEYIVANALDLTSVDKTVRAAMEDKHGIFVFDSLSSLLSKHEGAEGIVKGWLPLVKDKGSVGIYLYQRWEEEAPSMSFDYVIRIESVEERILSRNYFRVVKAPHEVKDVAVPFRIGFDGVAVYVPKIIVTGPYHAGKTTFIHKISSRAVSVNRLGTTIALDHGYVEHSGLSVDLFGTPGQERFEFMLDILNKDAFGVILVVDSTDPSSFERAKEMLKHVSRYALPYVVAANKQDLPNALKPEEVKKRMGVDVPVVGTVATTGEGCMEALKRLIDIIVG